jgi:hypothetical protein
MIIKGFCRRVEVIIYSYKNELRIKAFLSLGRAWIKRRCYYGISTKESIWRTEFIA